MIWLINVGGSCGDERASKFYCGLEARTWKKQHETRREPECIYSEAIWQRTSRLMKSAKDHGELFSMVSCILCLCIILSDTSKASENLTFISSETNCVILSSITCVVVTVLFLPGCDEYQSLDRANGIKFISQVFICQRKWLLIDIAATSGFTVFTTIYERKLNVSRPRRAVNTGPWTQSIAIEAGTFACVLKEKRSFQSGSIVL